LPKSAVVIEDLNHAKSTIKIDLKERINSYITKIDHSFGIENYNHVLQNSEHDAIKDVYRKLGPFDHFEHMSADDIEDDASRAMRLEFDVRKSGALFRGQVNDLTQRPDGIGFKVYPNGSVFGGFFVEG